MAEQQATNLGPVPTDTPVLQGSLFTRVWILWLQGLRASLNKSPQIVAVPANSAAPGTPGQVAYDPNFFYQCVAKNTWRRSALVAF